jgi:hypothetical protein
VPTARSRCRPHSARPSPPGDERPELRDPLAALDVLTLAVDRPLRPQVVLVLLDDEHRGGSIIVFDTVVPGARPDDAVLDITRLVAEAGGGPFGAAARQPAVVLASVRPGRSPLVDDSDASRFDELDGILAGAGVTLLDWFLIGDEQCTSMGETIGAPWRWKGDEPAWGDAPQ